MTVTSSVVADVGGSVPVDARRQDASVTAATRTFPPDPDAVHRARHFVIETLRGAGRLDRLGEASLVVTELAANAINHANTDFTVSVVVTGMGGETVRLSVRDGSTAEPVLDLSAAGAPSRRGLQRVVGLASQWGSVPLSDGKVVWAELAADGPRG